MAIPSRSWTVAASLADAAAGTIPSDGGAHLVCVLNLVPESTAGAHEVRPYGNQFGFATYARESHSTATLRFRRPAGGNPYEKSERTCWPS